MNELAPPTLQTFGTSVRRVKGMVAFTLTRKIMSIEHFLLDPISFKDGDGVDVLYVGEGEGTLTLTVQRARSDRAIPTETASVSE